MAREYEIFFLAVIAWLAIQGIRTVTHCHGLHSMVLLPLTAAQGFAALTDIAWTPGTWSPLRSS